MIQIQRILFFSEFVRCECRLCAILLEDELDGNPRGLNSE